MSAAIDGIETSDLDEAVARCRRALAKLHGERLFLTGGTGFFGRWLLAVIARARVEFDIRVTVLTRDPDGFRRMRPDLAGQAFIELAQGDIRSFEYPAGRFSHIIHAATDTSAQADADKASLIDTIVTGTRRVLEFAAVSRAERLLYVSSGAIYGPQPADVVLLPESYNGACDPLDPRSAYGEAKRMAEQLCVCSHAAGGPAPIVARAFAFVGPGLPLDGHFAIGNFIRDAVAGRHITVSGDGSPTRSYLYAGDLAAWLFVLLLEGEAGAAYNVGSDRAVSIAGLAHVVARLSPHKNGVVIKGQGAGGPRSRYIPSIEKARGLGLEAWTPLDEAIRRTIRHAEYNRSLSS
jgi:nucleoside-diphosphate-sugar epimerase